MRFDATTSPCVSRAHCAGRCQRSPLVVGRFCSLRSSCKSAACARSSSRPGLLWERCRFPWWDAIKTCSGGVCKPHDIRGSQGSHSLTWLPLQHGVCAHLHGRQSMPQRPKASFDTIRNMFSYGTNTSFDDHCRAVGQRRSGQRHRQTRCERHWHGRPHSRCLWKAMSPWSQRESVMSSQSCADRALVALSDAASTMEQHQGTQSPCRCSGIRQKHTASTVNCHAGSYSALSAPAFRF